MQNIINTLALELVKGLIEILKRPQNIALAVAFAGWAILYVIFQDTSAQCRQDRKDLAAEMFRRDSVWSRERLTYINDLAALRLEIIGCKTRNLELETEIIRLKESQLLTRKRR